MDGNHGVTDDNFDDINVQTDDEAESERSNFDVWICTQKKNNTSNEIITMRMSMEDEEKLENVVINGVGWSDNSWNSNTSNLSNSSSSSISGSSSGSRSISGGGSSSSSSSSVASSSTSSGSNIEYFENEKDGDQLNNSKSNNYNATVITIATVSTSSTSTSLSNEDELDEPSDICYDNTNNNDGDIRRMYVCVCPLLRNY